MNACFVDTGFWFALRVNDDRWHREATRAFSDVIAQGTRLITSSLVVGETYTLLTARFGRAPAMKFLDRLQASERVVPVMVDSEADADAWSLIRQFDDQDFSYVDATSFALMRRLHLTDALAFDSHFATAGFVRVPVDRRLR